MHSGFRLKTILTGIFSGVVFFTALTPAQDQRIPDRWLTDYERSGHTKTPRYKETMEYCRKLEKASPWVRVTNFGKSPEGRLLPLVIVSKEGAFSAKAAAKTGKAILLIQNGIHAGEIDGKDACLMLIRDMTITKTMASLLDHVILLVIPIYNVDGHENFGPYHRINQHGPEEMGWRVTAQNLNLNRDYLKADAPETRAWLGLFHEWKPDFFIDAHVTDGTDYQNIVTYGIESHVNVAAPVRSWVKKNFLPMVSSLKPGGVPISPYIFLRDDLDPLKGIQGGTAPPRYSTIYTTLHNRPGLLIETHMLKEYKSRVEGTYDLIVGTLGLINREASSLRAAVRRADEETMKGLGKSFPVLFASSEIPNETVRYLGIKQRNEPSEISGTTRRVFTGEPFEAEVPRFDSIVAVKSIDPPAAYLIPQQWQEVIQRLKIHGVRLEQLSRTKELAVETYRFSNAKWQERPFEGRHPLTYSVTKSTERRQFPAGTVVVRLNQPAARVVIHALEPEAPDAFAAWGFFDAVFEEKEYAEDYVMETLAREMIAKDPRIREEFDAKVKADTSFAKNPAARLHFFYERSPYWESQVNQYPVARLMNDEGLATQPLR